MTRIAALLLLLLAGCQDAFCKDTVVVDTTAPCARDCYLRSMTIGPSMQRRWAQLECYADLCGGKWVCQ